MAKLKWFAVQRKCTLYEIDEIRGVPMWGLVDNRTGAFIVRRDEQNARAEAMLRNAQEAGRE